MIKGLASFARIGAERQINRWNTEDFKKNETTLCDTVMFNKCSYTFVKAHGIYKTYGNL